MPREPRTGLDDSAFAVADSAGSCIVRISPPAMPWRVTQVSIEVDGDGAPAGATCTLRKNGRIITPLVPDVDAAGGDPPVPLRTNDVLTVEWVNLDPGQRGTVNYFYDEIPWTS